MDIADITKAVAAVQKALSVAGEISLDLSGLWKGKTPASFDDVTDDIDKIIAGVMGPLADGFQLPDLLAMREPVMAGIMRLTGVMDIPNWSDDPSVLTKRGIALMAYARLVDHFDPDIEFNIPLVPEWIEDPIEAASEKVLILIVRKGGPIVIENIWAIAAQKFPEILGR